MADVFVVAAFVGVGVVVAVDHGPAVVAAALVVAGFVVISVAVAIAVSGVLAAKVKATIPPR